MKFGYEIQHWTSKEVSNDFFQALENMNKLDREALELSYGMSASVAWNRFNTMRIVYCTLMVILLAVLAYLHLMEDAILFFKWVGDNIGLVLVLMLLLWVFVFVVGLLIWHASVAMLLRCTVPLFTLTSRSFAFVREVFRAT